MTTFRSLVALMLVMGACAYALGRACAHSPRQRPLGPRTPTGTMLVGRHVTYTFHPGTGRVTVRSVDGAFLRDLDLECLVDGDAHALELGQEARVHGDSLAVSLRADTGGTPIDLLATFRLEAASDALVVTLSPRAPVGGTPHALALRVDIPTEGRTAFISGVGELGDLGTVMGPMVTIDADPAPLGIVSRNGPVEVAAVVDEAPESSGTPMRIAVTSPKATVDPAESTDLRVVLGASSTRIWGTLYQLAGTATARVRGSVSGAHGRARIYGLDAEGAPRVSALAAVDGRFVLDVPKAVVQWYAALDPSRTSTPITFVPGTPWDLRLDVSPGGELHVRIIDADTAAPLTARLIVHGIEGTLDPSFGPDYRASGAGPIIDALRGEVTTPVPVGRYRVAATKGIEWSIDSAVVDVASGGSVNVDLAPRHVVSTPGVVGCDLHVHARPSFDTPVQPEDRILSLVAAGVDFAVPSEHNIVGDYGPMLQTLDLGHDLAYVNGVEVTTFNPRFGHFGVFPYPLGQKVPPFRHTNVSAVFAAARRGDPNRILQVNHPRLPSIGYFEDFGFDPSAPHPPRGMRFDFDSIEVYNGYEMAHPERVEAVLRDYFALLNQGHRYVATGSSDSHRIQYQWAGYPRTMVALDDTSPAGDAGSAVDPQAVIVALRKGHATVTTGPILDVDLGGGHPGDEVFLEDDPVPLHVRVRAAPWVDVSRVDLVVGGKTVRTLPVEPRPTALGREPGSREEAEARTVRLDAAIRLEVGRENTWVVVIARGSRRMDDVLPFMPIVPMAMSNPIWVTRRKAP